MMHRPGADQFAELYNRSTGPSAAETNLAGIASGGAGNNNPYFQSLLDRGSEQISNRVNALKSATGRFGGLGAGGHVDALGQAISDFQTPLLYQNYNDSLNRQLQATGQIDAASMNRLGAGLGAATAGAQNQYASLGQYLSGLGQQDQAQQGGLGLGLNAAVAGA